MNFLSLLGANGDIGAKMYPIAVCLVVLLGIFSVMLVTSLIVCGVDKKRHEEEDCAQKYKDKMINHDDLQQILARFDELATAINGNNTQNATHEPSGIDISNCINPKKDKSPTEPPTININIDKETNHGNK